MAKPYPTVEMQNRNRNPSGKSGPVIVPNLTLSVPFTDIPNDPAVSIPYTFAVLRQGGNVGISDCDWAIVPAAGSAIPAAYFGGTYPSGQVHLIDAQGQQAITLLIPPGADATVNQFADIVLSNFSNCKPGAVTTYRLKAPGGVIAEDYVIGLAIPDVTFDRSTTVDQTYTININRTRSDNDFSNPSTVTVALTGTGVHPLTAADFVGGLLNQSVTFAAGQSTKALTVTVAHAAIPANDLTGVVTISNPSTGSQISGTAGSVAVAIPAAAGALPVVSVTVADVTWDRNPTTPQSYTINVSRGTPTAGTSSVALTVTGTGANPVTAADFTGGLLSTTVNFAAGETGPKATTVQVVAGALPANDLAGLVALSAPSGCTVSPTAGSVAVSIPKAVVVADAILALDIPATNWTRAAAAQAQYTINVRRSGNTALACSATLALAGSGANPLTGSDFVGGALVNQLVSFNAGDTLVAVTVTTTAVAPPTNDRTGDVSLSAPTNCKIDATGASIAVKIPQAIIVNPGILPPEYTDPDFTGMSAQGAACNNWADVQNRCQALDNNVLCKTKYVLLDPSYNDTGTRNLNYQGYHETSTGKDYPLIICGNPAKAKSRLAADINNRPHFMHFTLNGAKFMWLYGLAAEFPIVGGYQHDTNPAISFDGSTDCFATRNWLDAPCCIQMNNPVRPRCGANDIYGIWDGGDPQPWIVRIYIQCTGPRFSNQKTPQKALLYQNYIGNCRAPFEAADHTAAFYCGDGVSPDLDQGVDYPNEPYDLNWRDSWFFNNLILSTANYLIYNKNACNIWRNRVVSINNWTDVTGTGSPFHLIACRGGNWTGGTVKYNVVEARGGHNDFQSWNGVAEFNDWGGQPVNCFIHCNDPSKLKDGRFSKTLLACSHWRFRSNKNGAYQIGTARPDAGYQYYGDMVDNQWEGESAATGCTWNWESTYNFTVNHVTYTVHYNPNGTAVDWNAAGKNTERGTIQFPGDTFKTIAAIGALTKLSASSAVRQLTDATAGNGFTKDEKGIRCQTGLLWDGIGDGGGGGGDTYALDAANMTPWLPSDDMATDYPHSFITFLAGGGFEMKAQNNPTDGTHACLNLWHKTAPPDNCTFTFYYTQLDANDNTIATAEGIFALFRVRQKGMSLFGADPNGWAKASYRVHPLYSAPGSDLLIRDRTTGHRHSFDNHSNDSTKAMQCRLRKMDGGNDSVDNSTEYTPTTPNPVPTTGTSFLFVQNEKYKLEGTRSGTTLTWVKTKVSDGTQQTWAYDHSDLGPSGVAVGGWCGFGCFLGRHFKVEPVPGVPFVQ